MDKSNNLNNRLKEISKIVIFLLICVVLLNCLSPIFLPKNNNKRSGIKYENARGFYGEKAHSIEVLAIGNSDLYSAMNPLQLWNNHGITSYVSGEPSQNIFSAYYLLKEVYKNQRPEVVILEVDELFSKGDADDLDEVINNVLKYNFPFFEYHSRWKSMSHKDFKNLKVKYKDRMISKGYIYHNNIQSHPTGYKYMKENRSSALSVTTQLYLDKFMQLASDHQTKVLLVWYPSATTATLKRHQTIEKVANRYQIPFIDFNTDQYNTGFNWMTDTRDGGNHLNYSGATKMTKYIGQYLKDNYTLNDYRHDPHYEQWNKDYEMFMKKNKLAY